MIVYIDNIQYLIGCEGPHEIIGVPKIHKELYGAGSTLTFDIKGGFPKGRKQANKSIVLPLLVEAFDSATGKPIFHGHFRKYDTKFDPAKGKITTLEFEDNGRHLRNIPIFGKFKLQFEIFIATLLSRGKADTYLGPAIFKVGKYYNENTFNYESLKTLLLESYFDGMYLQESLDQICSLASCSWMIDSKTGRLTIFQLLANENTNRTISINSLRQGCVDIRKLPEELNYNDGFPLINKETTFGTNGDILDPTLLAFTRSKLSSSIADIPKGSVRLDYPIIPQLATRVVLAKLYTFPTGVGCNVIGPTISGDLYFYYDYSLNLGSGFQKYYQPGYVYHAGIETEDTGAINLKAAYTIDNIKSSSVAGFYLNSQVTFFTYTVTIKANGNLLYSFTSDKSTDPFEPVPISKALIGTASLADYAGQSANIEIEIISEEGETGGTATIFGFLPDTTCCALKYTAGNGSSDNAFTADETGNCDGDGFDAKEANLYSAGQSVVLSDGSLIIAQRFGDQTADIFNHAIRKVDPVTNIISTIAGVQAGIYPCAVTTDPLYRPTFGDPAFAQKIRASSLAKDSSDNIYFLDDYNFYIGKIDSNGILTLAFDLADLYNSWDSDYDIGFGRTLSILENRMYITDPDSCTVIRVDLNTGLSEMIAGIHPTGHSESYQIFTDDPAENATANISSIRFPACTTEDSLGNLYILTAKDIKKIDLDGKITTFAGGSPYIEPVEFTDDYKFHLYGNKDQVKIGTNPDSQAGKLYTYIFVDDKDNLYFSDNYQPIVRKLNISSGEVSPAISNLNIVFSGGGIFTPVSSLLDLPPCPLQIQPLYWPIFATGCPFYFDNFTNLEGLTAIASSHSSGSFSLTDAAFIVYKSFCE